MEGRGEMIDIPGEGIITLSDDISDSEIEVVVSADTMTIDTKSFDEHRLITIKGDELEKLMKWLQREEDEEG